MKKKYFLIMVIVFISIVIAFALGGKSKDLEIVGYTVSNLDIEAEVYDITKYNNQVFVLTSSGIAEYSEGSLSYIYSASLSEYTRFTVLDEYIIYVDNENKLLHILSLEGQEIKSISWEAINLKDMQIVEKMLSKEDKLWLLGRGSEATSNIIEVDLNNETTESILTEVEYSFDFISDEKLAVVLYDEGSYTINEYDLNTNAINELVRIDDDIWNIKYDEASNSIYYCGYIGLWKYSLDTKVCEGVINNNYSNSEYQIYNLAIDNEIILIANRKLSVLEEVTADQMSRLVILDNKDNEMRNLMPNIQLALQERSSEDNLINCEKKLLENYSETLTKKLLARDTDFDMLILDVGDISKLDNNNIECLEENDKVTESLDNIFDGIKTNIISKDNHIIGIPSELYLVAWDINSTLSEYGDELGGIDENWTWEDFLAEATECKTYFKEIENRDIWLTNWTGLDIIDYIYEVCNISNQLNEEEWRTLLITLKEAQDNDIIMTTEEQEIAAENQYVLHDTLLTMYKSEETEGQYILLPIVDENNPIYFMCGEIYCVNPYSENKDVAIDLLCESLKPEYYIDSISSMIYSNKEWYTEYYTSDLEELNANRINLNDSSFDKYTYAINHARPISSSLYGSYVYDTLSAYFEGNVEVDQVVEEICSYN